MRTPREIYAHYKIMPGLQLHQLRVAAVGKLICDNFNPPADGAINTRDVVLACLFHDMGNIIKADLNIFPELLKPRGVEYWGKVKSEYLGKYGHNEHGATSAIIREIELPEGAIRLVENVGFSKMKGVLADDSHYELKIVEYGDCRVSPHGIVPIRERFEEGSKRYIHRHPSSADTEEHYRSLTEAGYGIEQQIFSHTTITPDDINDASVAPIIEELWEYPVP